VHNVEAAVGQTAQQYRQAAGGETFDLVAAMEAAEPESPSLKFIAPDILEIMADEGGG